MPLGEFDGDIVGPVEEHQLALMEVHHVSAQPDAARRQSLHHRVQIVDSETDVVEAHLVELTDVGIGNRLRMPVL